MYIIDHKIKKGLHNLRDYLVSEFLTYIEDSGNKITQNKRDLSTKAISCFILNAQIQYRNCKVKIPLTLRESSYSKKVIVNGRNTNRKVSYTYTRSFIGFLQAKGYAELHVGGTPTYSFYMGKWEAEYDTSYVTMKPKMTLLMNNLVDVELRVERENIMILRDKNKNSVTFNHTEASRQAQNYLKRFNKFSQDKLVKLDEKEYDVQMYKVYNVTLTLGGRSFMGGSIQGLNKHDRARLEIDGERVCVYDYKGFEPSLVYSMCQEVMEMEDPYQIEMEDYDKGLLRKVGKTCLLIMLNADSKDIAHKAINAVISKEYDIGKLYRDGKIPERRIPVKLIMNMLEEMHHLISHKLYTGFGGEVQYAGGLINDYVVEYMMQNHNCLVLQVFDEFIVQNKYRKDILKCMRLGYLHVMGFDDNCNIVKEA